jgi:hypothetical protein
MVKLELPDRVAEFAMERSQAEITGLLKHVSK